MSTVEKQKELEDRLNSLHSDRNEISREIVQARKNLDSFTKNHGDIIFQKQKDKEWAIKQQEFAERRKDPEWQVWHKKFMDERNKL